MGFTPSLLKKRLRDAVLLWCMFQAGPPSLHYYCAVVLHSCIVLPPVGHSSNHEYYCCQLTRQWNSVSNFYRTFKVFIWLTLVVGDMGSGYTTTVELETRLEAVFGGLPDSGDCFLHLSKYQDFRSLVAGLKEFYSISFLLILPHSS